MYPTREVSKRKKKQKVNKLESRRRLKNRNINKSIEMNIQKIHM